MEEKEQKEFSKRNDKKPPSRFYKVEDTRRIVPIIDGELKKKIEKADIVTKDKKEGIKKTKVKKAIIYLTCLLLFTYCTIYILYYLLYSCKFLCLDKERADRFGRKR